MISSIADVREMLAQQRKHLGSPKKRYSLSTTDGAHANNCSSLATYVRIPTKFPDTFHKKKKKWVEMERLKGTKSTSFWNKKRLDSLRLPMSTGHVHFGNEPSMRPITSKCEGEQPESGADWGKEKIDKSETNSIPSLSGQGEKDDNTLSADYRNRQYFDINRKQVRNREK